MKETEIKSKKNEDTFTIPRTTERNQISRLYKGHDGMKVQACQPKRVSMSPQ
jgi:hypothetical protein